MHRGRHGRQQELEEGRQGLQARQDARRHHQDRRKVLDHRLCSEVVFTVLGFSMSALSCQFVSGESVRMI